MVKKYIKKELSVTKVTKYDIVMWKERRDTDEEQKMREPVGITGCDNYDEQTVRAALEDVLNKIHGLDFVKPGMKIAVKANLVSMLAPDKAATTHPALLKELCRMLIARGAEVVVGDSPGGIYTAAYVKAVYKGAGVDCITETGARLNDDFTVREVDYPEAVSIKNFTYTAWLDQADAIIDFCKVKTHGMMSMTCSVKNLFGTIPGATKPEYHMRFPNIRAFANIMVDLNEYFRPVLSIADAVDAMEGNGPTAGTPRHIGALLASRSSYDLDMACAHLIGLTREDVQTIEEACVRGLGPRNISEVQLIGDLEKYRIDDFDLVAEHGSVTFTDEHGVFGKIKGAVIRSAFATRPQVKPAECIGCRKCEQICPAHAITMVKQKPEIDRSRCIHCFCCQEFCPKGAMKVQHTPLGRMLKLCRK